MSFILMENSGFEREILSRQTLDEIDEITSTFNNANEMSKTFNCGTNFYILLKSDNREIKEPVYYNIYFQNDRNIIITDLYQKMLPNIKLCKKLYPSVDYSNTKYWLEHMSSLMLRKLVKIHEDKPIEKILK